MGSGTGELLALAGVSRRYGEREVLAPVDVTVAAGECVALMGPNGSGKSTLLRIAAGRDTATSGEVRLAGAMLAGDSKRARTHIAVTGDGVSFYPDLSVREHLELVATAHGAGERTEELVETALRECRLDDRAEAVPASLSSGQAQALQLAAVLVRPRRLLVLDEPEQRLDPAAREWLAGLLVEEKAAGTAVLLATHHTELAHAVADRTLVLHEGQVTAQGRPADALTGMGG